MQFRQLAQMLSDGESEEALVFLFAQGLHTKLHT